MTSPDPRVKLKLAGAGYSTIFFGNGGEILSGEESHDIVVGERNNAMLKGGQVTIRPRGRGRIACYDIHIH